MQSKIYGIDLDGVAISFIPTFSSYLKEKLDISYSDSEITDYWWYKCIPEITKSDFFNAFDEFGRARNGYRDLRPLPGAVDGIKFLMDNAKDVWFITGRPHYAYEDTTLSMMESFGVSSDHIIFSSGKDDKANVVNRLKIDTFIDDASHYAESLAENTGAKVYLMYATHNQDVNNPKITRVNNWEEFISLEMSK